MCKCHQQTNQLTGVGVGDMNSRDGRSGSKKTGDWICEITSALQCASHRSARSWWDREENKLFVFFYLKLKIRLNAMAQEPVKEE